MGIDRLCECGGSYHAAETRKFYRLEEMWSDASVLEHNDE
jgi:hypothetical protein